jgi:hypothetical protein
LSDLVPSASKDRIVLAMYAASRNTNRVARRGHKGGSLVQTDRSPGQGPTAAGGHDHHAGHHEIASDAAPSADEAHGEQREQAGSGGGINTMAVSATLHCLTGCAIGEVAGLIIGTAIGLGNIATIALAIGLAFVFGYALSTLPLVKAGLGFGAALALVLAADTLSIATMEFVDNAVMAAIPGAMDAGLGNPVFWLGMTIALTAAFVAAYPVNRYLLSRGKGHALTHQYQHRAEARTDWRRFIPSFGTTPLAVVILAFMLGGLIAAAAPEPPADAHGAALPIELIREPPVLDGGKWRHA